MESYRTQYLQHRKLVEQRQALEHAAAADKMAAWEADAKAQHACRYGDVLDVLAGLGIDAKELRDCLRDMP